MKTTVKVIWVVGVAISTETSHAQEIFVQGGTLGIGVGAALSINSRFGVHADFNAFKLSHDFTVGGNRYESDLRLRQGGLYGDFFPWVNSGFRITAGVRITDNEVSGNSVPTNGVYLFNGVASRAFPGEYATATVQVPACDAISGRGLRAATDVEGIWPRGRSGRRLRHPPLLLHALTRALSSRWAGDESADHRDRAATIAR